MKKSAATSLLALGAACGAFGFAPQSAMAQAAGAQANEEGEIVVTAQRRSERLVDVPISVTAVSSEQIERAGGASIDNLTKVTPGVFFQRATYGLSPTIRGIGSTLVTSGGEQNVGLYVDDIYYPTPTGNIFDLASVTGIEVLKGPQGTLFGRNATGGAVLVHTADPGFEPAARLNTSYERFGQFRASGYFNLPVTESVAVNGSVAFRRSDGYMRDERTDAIVNEGENFTARVKVLVEPTDNLSVILTMAHANLDDPSGTMTVNLEPAALLNSPAFGPIATDRFHQSRGTTEYTRTSTNEYSLRASLETGAGTVNWYTAYLRNALDTQNDLSATYRPNTYALSSVRTETFSQEVNFASRADEPLTYVVGLYYFKNDTTAPGTFTNGAFAARSEGSVESLAAYLDGTYTIGDWSYFAGVRYSTEDRDVDSQIGAALTRRLQSATESQWTPRVGVRYALDEDSNIYASFSRGFKAGIFDGQTLTGPGVEPEAVSAYEIGYKTASADFNFNTAAFYYDFKDTQVTAVISGGGTTVFSVLFNVPQATIYGLEADANWRLNDNWDLRFAAAYTHARYDDFPNAPGWVRLTPTSATFTNVIVDASGNHMVRSPEWTASSTLTYRTFVSEDHELELSVTPYYSSRVFHTFDNALSQDAYWTVDASASLTLGDHARVSIFGRNLTDEEYAMRMTQNTLTLNATVFAPPRIYGVSFGVSF